MRSSRAQLLLNNLRQFLPRCPDTSVRSIGPQTRLPTFGRRLRVKDIYVEFSLLGQSRQGQVAAAKVADNGIDWVGAVHQVEFRMERMP